MKKNTPLFNLGLLTTAAAALALSGCGQSQPQYLAQNQNAKICTDKNGKRVKENKCERRGGHGGGGFFWMFMSGGSRVPGYGGRAYGGSRYATPGRSYTSGRSFSGRPVTSASSRGGFGSSARGYGGGSSFSSGS